MPEPTPPPERPMSDETRSRLRAELLQHAADHRSSAPRWLVPAGAAAAVALVAGLGYWAISPGGSEPDGLPITGGGGTSSGPSAPADDSSSVPLNESTVSPLNSTGATPSTISESAGTTPAGPKGTVQVGTLSCHEEMEFVLQDATFAVWVYNSSSFWVKGDKFVLCDELDGRTTVHKALPLTPRDDVSTYAVSTDLLGGQVIRSAGGIVPSGAEDGFHVEYTFPDGHTEVATTTADDQGRTWWQMNYVSEDGGGNEMEKPEIEVTVTLSGVQKHYTLAWATDTCAQANHGC
jgi:hypothetical protein